MHEPSEQEAVGVPATPEGSSYFGTPISDGGNPWLAFSLAQNQIILGLSSLFTIATLQQSGEPGGEPVLFLGVLPILLAVIGSLPLLFGGYKLSRSESPIFTDINCSTNLLVLRLFGRKKKVAQAALVSSFLGLLTGISEELSFRGLGFPILATKLAGAGGEPSTVAALAASSIMFGLAHLSLGGKARDNLVTVGLQTTTGFWFGCLYLLGGTNLLVPAGAHALYDAFTLLEAHVAAVNQFDYAESIAASEEGKGSAEVDAEIQRLVAAGEVDAEAMERLRVTFFLADSDKNGMLSLSEVRSALFLLGRGAAEDRLAELFAAADGDGSGYLDLAEWVAFVMLLREGPEAPPSPPPSGLIGIR